MKRPKLRDSYKLQTSEPYPINEIPNNLIEKIGGHFVYLLYYNPVRTSILIRSNDLLSYCLFEEENHRYRTSDYVWEVNDNGNLIGKDVETGRVCFTWQPHGSQFTIHTVVPDNALKFRIKRPPSLAKETILDSLGFDASWVEIIKS